MKTLTSTDCVGVGVNLVGQLGFVCGAGKGSMGGLLDRHMRGGMEVNWVGLCSASSRASLCSFQLPKEQTEMSTDYMGVGAKPVGQLLLILELRGITSYRIIQWMHHHQHSAESVWMWSKACGHHITCGQAVEKAHI